MRIAPPAVNHRSVAASLAYNHHELAGLRPFLPRTCLPPDSVMEFVLKNRCLENVAMKFQHKVSLEQWHDS